jgi:predicted methyltransferase
MRRVISKLLRILKEGGSMVSIIGNSSSSNKEKSKSLQCTIIKSLTNMTLSRYNKRGMMMKMKRIISKSLLMNT